MANSPFFPHSPAPSYTGSPLVSPQSRPYKILMDIVDLLPKEPRCIYTLYMVALLPETVVCTSSVVCTYKTEMVEHPRPLVLVGVILLCVQNYLVSKLFEVARNVTDGLFTLRTHHYVKMVRHQHPSVNSRPLRLLTIGQRLYDDTAVSGTNKDVHPVNDCGGSELRGSKESHWKEILSMAL